MFNNQREYSVIHFAYLIKKSRLGVTCVAVKISTPNRDFFINDLVLCQDLVQVKMRFSPF